MRLKCGECETLYRIDESKIPDKGVRIQCKKCQNYFRVNHNHVVTSENLDSKRFCKNCSKILPVDSLDCPDCKLVFNSKKRSLMIDNNDYVTIDCSKECSTEKKKIRVKKRLVAGVTLLLVLLTAGITYKTKLVESDSLEMLKKTVEKTVSNITASKKDEVNIKPAVKYRYVIKLTSGGVLDVASVQDKGDAVLATDKGGMKILLSKKKIVSVQKVQRKIFSPQ